MIDRPRSPSVARLHLRAGAPRREFVGTLVCRAVSTVAVIALCGACASRGAPAADGTLERGGDTAAAAGTLPGPTTEPHLGALSPMTISLARGEVPTLVLTGTGFVPGSHGTFGIGGNSIRVGPATFDSIAANASGTTIRFALPLRYTDTTAKGRPSVFTPGQYPISVVTPKGTSNSLTLTMIL